MPLSRCPLNVVIYYPLLSTRSRSRILSPSLRCHLPHAPSTHTDYSQLLRFFTTNRLLPLAKSFP